MVVAVAVVVVVRKRVQLVQAVQAGAVEQDRIGSLPHLTLMAQNHLMLGRQVRQARRVHRVVQAVLAVRGAILLSHRV